MIPCIRENWINVLAIALLLIGALFSLSFLYYQILNWVVVAAAVQTAVQAHQRKNDVIFWLILAVAVLFNPLAPFSLRQIDWKVADVLAAGLFALSIVFFARAKRV